MLIRMSWGVSTFLLWACLYAPSWVSAQPDGCVDCHKDPGFRVKNRRLFDYYSEWIRSKHAEAGVTCSDCHGGKREVLTEDKDAAHEGVFLPSNVKSKVYFKNLPATCGRCHEDVYKHFITSEHYRELREEAEAPHCATCHGSMNSQVYYTSIVDTTCQTCHKKKELTDVASQAKTILQHLKIARAYLGWTTLYYDSKGQSGRMEALDERYERVADAWHRFNLNESERDSAELLHDLEDIFRSAWAEKNPGKPLP